MIAYVTGILTDVSEDSAVVESGGIGIQILVPSNVPGLLPPIGSKIKIYTYTHVREDAFLLYGFLTKKDLEMFKKCITVNGIGPKAALSILSALDTDSLTLAILSGDVKTISSAPGIGRKTAERLILELKGKVKMEDAGIGSGTAGCFSAEGPGAEKKNFQEAVEALVSLGYSSTEAMKAVSRIEFDENISAEEILKKALKNIY